MHPNALMAFDDELHKIAASRRKQKGDPNPPSQGARTLGAVAAPIGVVGANTALASHTLAQGSKPGAKALSQDHIRTMAQRMGVKGDIHINTPEAARSIGDVARNPLRQPFAHDNAIIAGGKAGQHMVNVPKGFSESIAGHELGHLKNMEFLKKYRLHKPVNAIRGIGQGPVGVLGALGGSAYAAGAQDPSWKPGVAQAALMAPTLTGEAMASARSARYMMKQYGVRQGLRRSANLLPAFGSYAALGLSPLAITAARKAAKAKRMKQMQKTSAAKDQANAFFGLPFQSRKTNTRNYEQGSAAAASPDRSTTPISGQSTANVAGSNTVQPQTGPGGV